MNKPPATIHPSLSAVADTALVPVQQAWDAWRVAEARLVDLEDVHWLQPVGAPRDLLHAYVSRSKIVGGPLSDPVEGPAAAADRLLVCVIKSHTSETVYAALASRAGRPA